MTRDCLLVETTVHQKGLNVIFIYLIWIYEMRHNLVKISSDTQGWPTTPGIMIACTGVYRTHHCAVSWRLVAVSIHIDIRVYTPRTWVVGPHPPSASKQFPFPLARASTFKQTPNHCARWYVQPHVISSSLCSDQCGFLRSTFCCWESPRLQIM